MLKETVVLFVVITQTLGAGSRAHYEKPEKFKDVPGCYLPDRDEVISFDSTAVAKPPHCMEYTCRTRKLAFKGCTPVFAEPSRIVADRTKPYPDCCPKLGPQTYVWPSNVQNNTTNNVSK